MPQATNNRLSGIWARTVPDRKFGFIKADGRDYFCHASNLDNCEIEDLRAGDKCSFVGLDTPKGLRAESARKEG